MYPEAPNNTIPFPRIARLWLLSGVGALGVAGLYALVLVIARTPSLASLPLFVQLFHTSLVAHVDLSVLVWFLAVACTLWSIEASKGQPALRIPYLEEAALISFTLGAAVIALSPWAAGDALMSNYIPVIASPLFFLGLSLVGCGVALQLVHYFLHAYRTPPLQSDAAYVQSTGAFAAAMITLIALACFAWSVPLMPKVFTGQSYYDLLFWGGGHVLQFTHTQVLIVAWVVLAAACIPGFALPQRLMSVTLAIGLFAALAALAAYLCFDIAGPEFRQFFTDEMIVVNGLPPLIIAVVLMRASRCLRRVQVWNAIAMALAMSMALFMYGAFLGSLISGQNVTIPAHYHGEIVGITLAFMGLTYAWLPRFGYRDIAQTRLARWQPVVLGLGQALHVSGLAWSGGYGVLRKTPGEVANIALSVKVALGFMGLGGVIAIAGGLMFVIAVWRSVRKPTAA